MKKLLTLSFILLQFASFAQNSSWEIKYERPKTIIENHGQFDFMGLDDMTNVSYVMSQTSERIYFKPNGIVFEVNKIEKPNKSDAEKIARKQKKAEGFNSLKEWQEFERAGERLNIKNDRLVCEWVNSNNNPQIIPSDESPYYHNYTYFNENFKHEKAENVKSYKKLTYKNVYPNIDIVYEAHQESGIKYSIIVYPGGDINQIKLNYSKKPILLPDGSMTTHTIMGKIIDHPPHTFYSDNKNATISSSYKLDNNTISFEIGNYDHSKTLIIDPWTQSPNYNLNWDCVWETEVDAAGNVYIIGGVMPLELHKYNPAGALQWTYNTPYDTTGWLGSFATDDAGNSYVSNGSTAALQKINTGGGLDWDNPSPGGLFGSTEFWNISFNCDQTKLVIGGTGGSLPPLPYIYNVDMNSGNVTYSAQVTGGALIPTQEVRSITPTANEKYFFLTHDSIGFIDQGGSPCNSGFSPSFYIDNGIGLGYKCENWRNNNSGIEALAYYDGHVYVNKGNEVQKRAVATATIVATAPIPAGGFGGGFGTSVQNSGISIDDCGNVFVGSKNQVVQYDADLNQITTYPTSFNVYDVEVTTSGNIVAAGSTGTSDPTSTRTGGVQSIVTGACARQATECCNASICPIQPLCTSASPVTLEPFYSGGTFTPHTGLNTGTGQFNPATAGPGTHTIYYTLACGTDSILIEVADCPPMEVCVENNGDLTVSGGSGAPYTWFEGETLPTCVSGFANYCGLLTAQGPDAFTWTGFGNGTTITPNAGIDTIMVEDGFGNQLTINGLGTLPSCSASCDATITQAGPFCDNASPVTLSAAETGGTWSGTGITNTSTGAFDPATAEAGSHVISYNLTCGDNDTMTIVVNPSPDTGSDGATTLCTTDSPVDLFGELGGSPNSGGSWSPAMNSGTGVFDPSIDAGGTYTYTVTNSCGTSSNDVVVTVTSNPNPGTNGVAQLCSNATPVNLFDSLTGTPDAGGTWSPVLNSGTGIFDPSIDGAGTYIYSLNACGGGTLTAEVQVTIIPSLSPGTNGVAQLCANASTINLFDSLTGAPDAGGTWSPALNSGTGIFDPTIDAAGTYTYTVIGCDGSNLTADVEVTINPIANAGIDGALSICPTDAATDLFGQLTGSPNAGGTWSPAMNSGTGVFDPSIDAGGTYTYTVTNSCGSDNSDVVVTVTSNPDPGTNGVAQLCANASTINLFDSLNGTPTSGGAWSPTMNSGTGVFDPAIDAAGTYTYTLNACGGGTLTAEVQVTINPAPNAGIDGAITLCTTDAATDLFGQLTGSPDAGGTWSPAMNSGTGVFDPSIDAGGTYTYTVTNSCGSDNSDVVVTVTSNPDPGTNGVAQLCANASTINLFDSLNGTPTSGGAWSPTMNSGTGVFDPAIDAAGTYTYTLNACGGGTLTAEVQVTINPAPNAGIDGAITLCTTDAATNLFGQLTGSPETDGTWSPAMNSGTGVFDPSIDASGTYTYTVTNTCGSDNSNVVVSVNPCTVPTALFSASDDTICAGECVTFTDQSTGATSWQWTFNGGTPSSSNQQNPGDVCFAIDGTYTIELVATNTFGSDTYTSTLTVHPTPIVDAGSDVIIKLNESTQLNASGSTGNYTWTPSTGLDCTSCPNPISSPEETITYTVIVSDPNGCTATDDITVFVEYENVIFVPNIFSPNGDGQNDILFVRGKGVQELKFFIYDRWGEKVFETTSLDEGWDGTFRGKEMNKAVFVYYLEATFIDGEEVKQKGDITLVK